MIRRGDAVGGLSAGAPLDGAQSQAASAQPPKQFPARRHLRSGGDQLVEIFFGHVVVVALEAAARDPCPFGKRMQFVVADITDEM